MEEDIKILEEYKDNYLNIHEADREGIELGHAIENLIKGYRELEEENKKWEEWAENAEYDMSVDYIPKSKVKEKIEELEKEDKETYTKFLESDRANANLSTKGKMIQGAIEILNELLED